MKNFLKAVIVLGLLATAAVSFGQGATKPIVEWLTPEDDWVAAIHAGGTVRLGPGEFLTTELVVITHDLDLQGAGNTETFVTFDSDGGQHHEQVLIHSPSGRPLGVRISDISILHGRSHRSDLITLLGPVHVELDTAGIGFAYDDAEMIVESGITDWLGTGMLILDGASLSAQGSFFFGNLQGIAALEAGQVTIRQSTFQENYFTGLYAEDTPLSVTLTLFRSNMVGLEVYGTAARHFEGNGFEDQFHEDVIDED